MVSIVRNSKYKDVDISITYTSDPTTSGHPHHHHPPSPTTPHLHEDEMMDEQAKVPSFFFPPKMVIRFKDEEIDINKRFHAIRTYQGRYFTHYFPYHFFESPLNLSQEVVNSLIVKDEIKQLKKIEG